MCVRLTISLIDEMIRVSARDLFEKVFSTDSGLECATVHPLRNGDHTQSGAKRAMHTDYCQVDNAPLSVHWTDDNRRT